MGEINKQQKIFWEDNERINRRHPNHPVVTESVAAVINFIKKNVDPEKNKTLLDIGCGNGFFTYHLAKTYDVTGLDYSGVMLKINPHQKLVQGNAENTPFKDNCFDVVFCANLLHHVSSPQKIIKEMKRVAKNYVIISEPNRNNPLIFLFSMFKKEERSALKFTKKYLIEICQKENLKAIKSLVSGFIFPNKTPNSKLLLSCLRKFDFNQPLGSSVTIIFKK